jgi:hypothetical protein
MFFAPGHVFGGREGARSRFHVLRSRTRFRRYGGRRLPFSCFALRDSFSAVPRASVPVFMFYTPELVFGGTEDVWFCFNILRSRTYFRRYRGRRVPFLYFALPDLFSLVPRVSCPVVIFCVPGLIFDGSRFHVLRPRTHFRRHRGRRDPFSCFTLPDSISTVPRASGPFFKFCAPGLVFSSTEGVRSRFHVLRSRAHFRRYGGRRIMISYFALPDSFSAAPRASGPVFMFCAPGLVFGGNEGVGSRFHILRS